MTGTWHPSLGTERPAGPVQDRPRGRPASKGSWVLASVALVALAVLALWVTHSAVFRVRSLTVSGNRHLSRGQVLNLAGLDGHTNVLWLSTGKVERRLAADPWIRSVHVSRTLPTSIAVTISERTAVAGVRSRGRLYLIAADGVVLGPARSRMDLPVVDVRGAPVRIGSRLRAASGALGAIQALPTLVRARVVVAKGEGGDGLVLELRGGIRAIYGDGSGAAAKAEALAAVLGWANRQGVALAYVDLRAPVTPAAGPVVPASPTPAVSLHPSPAASPTSKASPVATAAGE